MPGTLVLSELPFDILSVIVASVDDSETLSKCVLVNSAFRDATMPILYQNITIRSPESCYSQNSKRCINALETLAVYPHLRPYVRSVYHYPLLSETEQYRNAGLDIDLPSLNVLSKLPQLRSYTILLEEGRFLPSPYLAACIKSLSQCSKLSHLNLLFDLEDAHVESFDLPEGITSLSLGRPTYDSFSQLFPRLNSLESLIIKSSEYLHSIGGLIEGPHLRQLQHLTLGPKHAMSNIQLLDSISMMTGLVSLDIFYDGFLNSSDDVVQSANSLGNLRYLIVRHQGVGEPRNFNVLFQWLAALAQPSPLCALSIISDDLKLCKNPILLLRFMKKQQGLQFLNITHVQLRAKALSEILQALPRLETISFFLADAKDLSLPLSQSLQELTLSTIYLTSDTARFADSNAEFVKIVQGTNRQDRLRRIFRRGRHWKALWTSVPDTQRKGLDPLRDEFPAQGREAL